MSAPGSSQETPSSPQQGAFSSMDHPLAEKTEVFPHLPGVYLFRDEEGRVIYAGKARDLRKRAASYFRSNTETKTNVKVKALLSKARDLEFLVTATEKEALLLEASLIKKHRPRYNVILRDDKNYPSLRIDPREPFPRLEIVRKFQKDGAFYFGPYPSGHALRETLRMLNQLFPLRQCRGRKLITRDRPCLNHAMKRCPGVCAGKSTAKDYAAVVEEVILFLQGRTDALQIQLRREMENAAARLDFEKAAQYRDRLRDIESMLEKQHMVSSRFQNQDILGVWQNEDATTFVVLFVRQGALVGRKEFHLSHAEDSPEEILSAFIQQFYGEGHHIPDEVVIGHVLDSQDILQEWLSEMKGKKVRIWTPRRGERKHLLELAENNARERHASRRRLMQKHQSLLQNLGRITGLRVPPIRMACVDISNIQGLHAVGAVVVFSHGEPDKSSYRHYRVHGMSEPDDPAMMAEVVERFLNEEAELASSLNLLVVDGGKGQLNRIHRLIKEKGLTDELPVISLAKEKELDRGEKGRGFYEKIYLPGRKNPIFLSQYPDILHLLQRLRDEAHRFAITNYQMLHRRQLLTSALDGIPGIGPKRRRQLLQHFGSMEELQRTDLSSIKEVPGISEKLARLIHDSLHSS